MNFDPEAYTLTIRKENVDGDILFVGRVAELQDVTAYEESYEEAHSILLDAISSLKQIADEQNRIFPAPFETEDEYSGRVTLRFTKSLHKSASVMAEREGVSLNQFLNTIVAEAVGERKVKVTDMMKIWSQLADKKALTLSTSTSQESRYGLTATTTENSQKPKLQLVN